MQSLTTLYYLQRQALVKLFSLPFNMNTFYEMWGAETPDEVKNIIESQRFKGTPKNLEEQALSMVGTDIYEALIKGYTEKQWGKKATELPTFLIKRLPLRFIYDNNYFINKISNGIYKPVNLYAYNKQLLSNEHVINDIITLPINYTYCFDSKINRKINLINKIINNLYE